MQLQLKPDTRSLPIAEGWLIRGTGPAEWLQAFAYSGISLAATEAYAIPGTKADSIWGCLVCGGPTGTKDIPIGSPLNLVAGCLYIPEFTCLFPSASDTELKALLKGRQYFLHPEVGLVALETPLRWEELITLPADDEVSITIPAAGIFIPSTIRSFEVKAAPPDENILQLEGLAPERKQFEDKPLNALEKVKLGLLRQLFGKGGEAGEDAPPKGFLLKKLEALAGSLGLQNSTAIEKLQEDLEDLERRNSSEVDKLLKLIKDNPEEALKYAIPIGDGAERGTPGALHLSKRWSNFSLFGNSAGSRGSGTVSISDDHQSRLAQEYRRMAETLANSGDYEKAAFIYLKLLKDYKLAALTLDKGGRYAEAAAIYLKYCSDKAAAAASYVKGNMLSAAIDIYTELGRDEDAGDLYIMLNDQEAAYRCYQKVADGYVERTQFLKAAKLRKEKMNDTAGAQELLLRGWRSGKDGYNCLHVYFSNIDDEQELALAIKSIYRHDTAERNTREFLNALKSEAARSESLSALAREIATELVSAYAKADVGILSELRTFHKKNTLITKDILRYRSGRKK